MTEDDELYEHDIERQWSESASVQGVSQELMSKGQRPDDLAPRASRLPATFSPWLIPFSALLTGPLVATLLTLLVDGDPPRARHALVVICTGLTAWVINIGVATAQTPFLSPSTEGTLRLAVLGLSGLGLWALYTFWIKGRKALNQRGLINSAVILFALSLAFWVGRDTAWWDWLGR